MLDLLMVLVIFGIARTEVSHSAIQPGPRVRLVLEAGGYIAGLPGAACMPLLIGLRQFRGRVQERIIAALGFLPQPLVARIEKVLLSFEEGMQSTRSTAYTLLLVLYTVIAWIMIAASFSFIFQAFPATSTLSFT